MTSPTNSRTDKADRLGWIGLGNMGMAMAANLAAETSRLAVYNRTLSRSEQLVGVSAAIIDVCNSVAELVKASDIIFICLADDEALRDVVEQITSQKDVQGKLVVDQSTVHPATSRAVQRRLADLQCDFLAAPVFGAPAAAKAARLVVAYAGPSQAYDRAAPYFSSMSRAQFGLGDDPGKASLMKLTGNSFILSMIETVAEGLVFSEASGLGVDNCMTFLSTVFSGSPWEAYAQRMVSGNYMPPGGDSPGFAVGVAHKDCSHAISLARDAGYSMPILHHVQKSLESVGKDDRYEGRGDVSSVYGIERERAGLRLENTQVAKRLN